MSRVGYFLTESREKEALDAQASALKQYGARKIYADYVRDNYKTRAELSKAISSLNEGDKLIVRDIVCIGTTISEISKNLQKILNKSANLFVIDKEQGLTYGRKHLEYIMTAHRLQVHLSRHRATHDKQHLPIASRRRSAAIAKRRQGRPTQITDEVRYDARKWVSHETTIHAIMERYGISRSTAYRLKQALAFKTSQEIEEERFL